MPNVHMCSNCKFKYISQTPYNYPDDDRFFVPGCMLMKYISMKERSRLDINSGFCPNTKFISDNMGIEDGQKLYRNAILRMYRNGYPSFKNMDPLMLIKLFNDDETPKKTKEMYGSLLILTHQNFDKFYKIYHKEEIEE